MGVFGSWVGRTSMFPFGLIEKYPSPNGRCYKARWRRGCPTVLASFARSSGCSGDCNQRFAKFLAGALGKNYRPRVQKRGALAESDFPVSFLRFICTENQDYS
jgi:hypothetical protein